MFRTGIWDEKWRGKEAKTGKPELGARNGKMGQDLGYFSRFPVHFRFFLKPVQ
jgi:hypothetical protein